MRSSATFPPSSTSIKPGSLTSSGSRYGTITIPAAVAAELHEGRLRGVDLPSFESLDWMRIRQPAGRLLLPIITDLGAGEREVLALGTETPDSLVILDDTLARRYARC